MDFILHQKQAFDNNQRTILPDYFSPLILVKMAGEIHLKSTFVRIQFEKKLVDNIKSAAKKSNISITKIERGQGLLKVFSNDLQKTQILLSNIFGISNYSFAQEIEFSSLDDLIAKATDYSLTYLNENNSFAIRAKRFITLGKSSQEISALIGEQVLEKAKKQIKVNLSKPDFEFHFEINKDKFLAFHETKPGLNGLPVSCNGKFAWLVNSNPDCMLAGLLLMKRGCLLQPVAFTPFNQKFIDSLQRFSPVQMSVLKFDSINSIDFKSFVEQQKILALIMPYSKLDISQNKDLLCFYPLQLLPKELKEHYNKIINENN